jgi:tetratricopeptide (TPR) repeat protein
MAPLQILPTRMGNLSLTRARIYPRFRLLTMTHPLLGGRYQIIRRLGGGGFGQTFLAEDQHLPGKPFCVVKHLQPKSNYPEALQAAQRLFEAEAAVLHELGHHNQIPRLTAHFQEADEFYLVQEFIHGTVLSQELKQRRSLSELEVLDLLLEVLTVLEFVHQHQVIHRDIKPANLIRRQADGKIVLIDFGAVKQLAPNPLNPETSPSIAVGSSGYSPPEQLAGKACYGSDIYAIGMIALQALTGTVPKQLPVDPDTHEVKWRGQTYVSHALSEILDRMVRYDFRQRYRSVSEVLTELRTLNREVIQANQADDSSLTWVERGNQFFQQNSHREALAAYDAAIQSNPLSPIAWLKRGMALDSLQQFASALTCYDRVSQLDSGNIDVWAKRGLVLENLGRLEEALASYRKVVELDGQNYWAWYDQGKVLESLGQVDIALNAYRRALQIKPNFQLAIESRKRLLTELKRLDELLELGYYDEALSVVDILLKVRPDDGAAWLGQGLALSRQGCFEAALTALDLAVELQPDDLLAWMERGKVLSALHQDTEAVRCYDYVIQSQGSHVQAWLERAIGLERLQNYEAAMLSYNQAMELDSTLAAAIQGRERTLRCLQIDQAGKPLGEDSTVFGAAPTTLISAPQSPSEPEVAAPIAAVTTEEMNYLPISVGVGADRLLKDRILEKLHDHRDTVAAYNKAIQLNPNDPEVLQWRGNLLVALGRYEEAIAAYDRAIQAMPNNAKLWCCLAGSLIKLKRHREAIECFDRAIDIQPNSHTPWYWRGRVMMELKRFPEAMSSLEQALVIKPDFQPAKHDRARLQQHLKQPIVKAVPNQREMNEAIA